MSENVDRKNLKQAVEKTQEAMRGTGELDVTIVAEKASRDFWKARLGGASLEDAEKTAIQAASKIEYVPSEKLVSYYTKCFFVGSLFLLGFDRAIYCSRLYDHFFVSKPREIARRQMSDFPFEISAAVAWRAAYRNETTVSLFDNGNLSLEVEYFLGIEKRRERKVRKFKQLFRAEIVRAAKMGVIQGSWGKLVLLNNEPVVEISEEAISRAQIAKMPSTRVRAAQIGGIQIL